MELDEKKLPIIFKAFCDENRIKILKQLLTGEKCACVLLDNTFPPYENTLRFRHCIGPQRREMDALLHLARRYKICNGMSAVTYECKYIRRN